MGLVKSSISGNERVAQPLWECVPVADYDLPVAPVTHSLRKRLAALKSVFLRGEPEQEAAFKAEDKLRTLPQRQLERVAPAPDWRISAEALDIVSKDWLEQKKPDHPGIVLVGPPHSGHTKMLSAWAKLHGWPVLSPPSAEEILEVTGCVQGAVTPLGLPDGVPVIFDEAIARCDKVSISSGDPMAGLELGTRDLIRIAGARLAPIAAGSACARTGG